MERQIDFSRFTRTAENTEVSRQSIEPQLRPRIEIERNPTYHQARTEREGRSEWSGGSMGGGVWAGRLAHRER
jgi:hypothetical protein